MVLFLGVIFKSKINAIATTTLLLDFLLITTLKARKNTSRIKIVIEHLLEQKTDIISKSWNMKYSESYIDGSNLVIIIKVNLYYQLVHYYCRSDALFKIHRNR